MADNRHQCRQAAHYLLASTASEPRKLVGLARCLKTAIIFVDNRKISRLRVRSLVPYSKQQEHNPMKLDSLRTSSDPPCRQIYYIVVDHQQKWTRRLSPAVELVIVSAVITAANPPAPISPGCSLPASRTRLTQIIYLLFFIGISLVLPGSLVFFFAVFSKTKIPSLTGKFRRGDM